MLIQIFLWLLPALTAVSATPGIQIHLDIEDDSRPVHSSGPNDTLPYQFMVFASQTKGGEQRPLSYSDLRINSKVLWGGEDNTPTRFTLKNGELFTTDKDDLGEKLHVAPGLERIYPPFAAYMPLPFEHISYFAEYDGDQVVLKPYRDESALAIMSGEGGPMFVFGHEAAYLSVKMA